MTKCSSFTRSVRTNFLFRTVVVLVLLGGFALPAYAFDWNQLKKMGQQIGNAAADQALRQGLAQLPPEVAIDYETLQTNMTEGRFTLTNVTINRLFENRRSSTKIGSILVTGVNVLDTLAGKTSGADNLTLDNINFRHALMENGNPVDNWVGKVGKISLDNIRPVIKNAANYYQVGRAVVDGMAIENHVLKDSGMARVKRLAANNIDIKSLLIPEKNDKNVPTDDALEQLIFDRAVIDGRSAATAKEFVSIITGAK